MHFYRVQKLDEFAAVRRKQQLKKRRQQSEYNRQTTYLGMGVPSARMPEPPPPVPSEYFLNRPVLSKNQTLTKNKCSYPAWNTNGYLTVSLRYRCRGASMLSSAHPCPALRGGQVSHGDPRSRRTCCKKGTECQITANHGCAGLYLWRYDCQYGLY